MMGNWRWDKYLNEKSFKSVLYISDRLNRLLSLIKSASITIFLITVLVFFLLFTYYIGFSHADETLTKLKASFRIILVILFFTRLSVGLLSLDKKKKFSFFLRVAVLLLTLIIIGVNSGILNKDSHFWSGFYGTGQIITACFILSMLESSRLFDLISKVNFPPAFIFSLSFLLIILIGSGLLILPNSRTGPMSYLDSLFTSVSAVCVTGLIVVNTSTAFTIMGKIIILGLIQIGGLGIMTFTGFFSFIFTNRTSLQERMLLQDMFSSESLGNLYKILMKIILFTFLLEGIGACLIYLSLESEMNDKVFFSIFHSVSAFCNAGFSTLSNGLMSSVTNKNHFLLSVVMILIVLGGLGFPVMLKLYSITKSRVLVFFNRIIIREYKHKREWLDTGSRIVVRMTLLLLISGALLFFTVERSSSMRGMSNPEKVFLSLFNSVTARTAGFNISDLLSIGNPGLFLLIFLMWIGASPGSTGGGIKTVTFSIAVRNAWSIIKGRKSLEISNREINQTTISRVLSIIILSILVIGIGFFCLLISDPDKDPIHLLFESVSAFSTVGLSLADSSTLSNTGKFIDILLMFIGRVGPLTLITGIFVSTKRRYIKYPGSDIVIN